MRNFTKFLIGSFLFPFIYTASYGAVIFVDKNISSNCLSGNYSIAGRNCSGADGNAYSTIQSALNSMNGGDDIYMRGGTYQEGSIIVPSNKNGTASNFSSLRSYPNEWAVLDGQNKTSNADPIWGAVIGRNGGLSYWEFGNFEIKNGATSSGSTATGLIYGGNHGRIHHLYIHDNVASTGSNNPSGIKLEKPKYTLVEYCHFYNNGMSSGTNLNSSNINTVSDYVEDPKAVNINNAEHHNEYRYNLIEQAPIGFKYKGFQYLSLSRDGQTPHMTYKEYGDKIHHNIFRSINKYPLWVEQDFAQIYNNIFDMSSAKEMILNSPDEDDREPFYATVYNNTFIRTRLCIYHDGVAGGDHSSYTISYAMGTPAKPYFYFFNNIVESIGAVKDGRNDLNILFTYKDWDVTNNDIDLSKVFVERNLFIPRKITDKVINVGEDTYDYSISEYISNGWASKLYAVESKTGLYKASNSYKTNGSFSLGSSEKVINGGIGGSHPYISGVKIPSYVGATDPNNDNWVDVVLGLSSISNLKFVGTSISTSSTSSSSGTFISLPPPPTKLLVVE